jgi:hypothetical protein
MPPAPVATPPAACAVSWPQGGGNRRLDVELRVERARDAAVADLTGAVEVSGVDDDVEGAQVLGHLGGELEDALVVEGARGREAVDREGAVGARVAFGGEGDGDRAIGRNTFDDAEDAVAVLIGTGGVRSATGLLRVASRLPVPQRGGASCNQW